MPHNIRRCSLSACGFIALGIYSLLHEHGLKEVAAAKSGCPDLARDNLDRWVIDNAAIRASKGDVQGLIDCIPRGDAVLFTVRALKLKATLNITRPIGIASAVTHKNGSLTQTQLVCPDIQPAMKIRAEGVTLSNMSFRDCNLNGASTVVVSRGSNVTITDTEFVNNTNAGGPGCILASKATVTMHDCLFVGNNGVRGGAVKIMKKSVLHVLYTSFEANSAHSGGVIKAEDASVTILESVFLSNAAADFGGAIDMMGDIGPLDVEGTVFWNNTAHAGGAISVLNVSEVVLRNTVFRGNVATQHGAALNVRGPTVPTILTVMGTTFVNNAAAFLGGAVLFNGVNGTILMDKGTNFTGNSAKEGGGLLAYGTLGRLKLDVRDSLFSENVASQGGGALETVGRVASTLENVTFHKNGARKGGALQVFERARMKVTTCTFTDNYASESGAGIFLEHNDLNDRGFQSGEDMIVAIDQTVIADNNVGEEWTGRGHAAATYLAGQGAGIFITGAGTNVTLTRSVIRNNTAISGGGIHWEQGSTLEVHDSRIVDNRAVLGGGMRAHMLDMVTKALNMARVKFARNNAQMGGGMSLAVSGDPLKTLANMDYMQGRLANLTLVEFSHNSASKMGGAVDLKEMLMACQNCSFEFNKAGLARAKFQGGGKGGAIHIGENGMAALDTCRIDGNSADDGGAVAVRDGGLTCSHVDFTGNFAQEIGGAVALRYGGLVTTPTGMLMNCTGCTMTGNRANKGGGIHLVIRRPWKDLQDCANLQNLEDIPGMSGQDSLDLISVCSGLSNFHNLLEERHITLLQTVLSHNVVNESGAAIFTSDPSHVEICCAEKCRLVADVSLQNLCQTAGGVIWENNTVVGEWHPQTVISSFVSQVNLTPSSVSDHASGRTLPRIAIELKDPFGQVVSGQKVSLLVKGDDPDMISGSAASGIVLRQGESRVGAITMRAPPGNYTIEFLFTVEATEQEAISVTVPVEVRNCIFGEVYDPNSLSCIECDKDAFSFNTSGSCYPCPSQAKCNGSTLTPSLGWWHGSSQSAMLQQCLLEEACKFEKRTDILGKAAFLAHRQGETMQWSNDSYQLCAKGYTGPLCGSCKLDHGRIGAAQCGKCPSKGVSYFLVVLAFLILVGIAAYLTSQALKYGKQIKAFYSDTELSNHASTSEKVLNVDEEAVPAPATLEVVATGGTPDIERGSGGNGASQGDRTRLRTNKMMEMYKILINFLQVIGTAASINVHWTESVSKVLALSELASGVSSGSGMLSFECAFEPTETARSIKSYAVQILSPFAIWLVFSIYWSIKKWRKQLVQGQLVQRLIVSLLVILYLSYINLATKIVGIYNCVSVAVSADLNKDASASFWAEDTSVKCFKEWHAWLVGVVGTPLLAGVVIGYPVGLTVKLLMNKDRLSSSDFIGRYGFLYKAYREKACFWEAFVLLRKALLATIVVFSESIAADQQGTLAVGVLLLGLLLHNYFQPYDDPIARLNMLELLSLAIQAATFLCGVLFIQNQGNDVVQAILSVVVIGGVVGYVFFLVYELVVSGIDMMGDWMIQEGLPVSGSIPADGITASKYLLGSVQEKFKGALGRSAINR